MIEFTANVISEDEPLFVPDSVWLHTFANIENGYIVVLDACNREHAEHIIMAMFPRCTIDDGPHEVACPAPDWS